MELLHILNSAYLALSVFAFFALVTYRMRANEQPYITHREALLIAIWPVTVIGWICIAAFAFWITRNDPH